MSNAALRLEKVSKSFRRGRTEKHVLDCICACLDRGPSRFGILGGEKSGKTTLLNIIAGVVVPDSGRVIRNARVSWPLGWTGFRRGMTANDQVVFLARLHSRCRRDTLRFVAEVSALGRKIYAPVEKLSRCEKTRLLFATALALDFDIYLVDEDMPRIHKEFARNFDALWQEKLQTSSLIVASNQATKLADQCSHIATLDRRQLSCFAPVM